MSESLCDPAAGNQDRGAVSPPRLRVGQPWVSFPSGVSPAATVGAQQTQVRGWGASRAGLRLGYHTPGVVRLWLHHVIYNSYTAMTQEEPFQSGYFG